MQSIFQGFWSGGYEGADHSNGSGFALDPSAGNAHAFRLAEDYGLARDAGLRTIRETAGWRAIDQQGPDGLHRLRRQGGLAGEAGLEVIWTLLHYGWPAHLDPFERPAQFEAAFGEFCGKVAQTLACVPGPRPVYQPVNEISFLAWAASATGLIHPHGPSSSAAGDALKKTLVRAAIRGMDAIWHIDPGARMVHTDPLIHVAPAPDATPLARAAAHAAHEAQFAAFDMLCGRAEPSLGGEPKYLDVIGLNYYHANQWDHTTGAPLDWHRHDPRRRPLARLLQEVAERYHRPILIAETGHVGDGRTDWFDDICRQVRLARYRGVRIEGICLYPLVDRTDWEEPSRWHRSGLWDLPGAASEDTTRVAHAPLLARLAHWQRAFDSRTTTFEDNGAPMIDTLIVFSHLRWDFVYQRPQQLLSRLAARYRVVFVEEPFAGASDDHLACTSPCPGVTVVQAHLRGEAAGFQDAQLPRLAQLVRGHLAAEGIENYLLWFYTPLAWPMAADLRPAGVVYDCMDELSAFRFASPLLVERERELMAGADLVFTGGASLHEAKSALHHDAHCFPSSVDAAHFGGRHAEHPAQVALPHPRLGYYGVIDERIDLDLIAAVADAHPDWQLVMVGPVVKISQDDLPRRPNIHWFGQRTYGELPQFLVGWNLCLMPFALNDSTRFISPTKTLEYLAAGKPCVSTPVRDVVSQYGGTVAIADTPAVFVAACEAILQWSAMELGDFRTHAAARVASSSWDLTVEGMQDLLERFDATATARAPMAAVHYDTVVIGAGPTGLAAGLALGEGALVLEKESTVGGWCRSIVDRGFTFDHAGHIMFSTDPFVLDLYERLLGDNMHWQDREAWIYSKSVYTRYPFQGALHGLPADVLKECLVGAIEARFGPLGKAPATTAEEALTAQMRDAERTAPPRNFEEFIYRVWGKGVAKHFAIPYNRKLWAVPLDEMETSWLGGRVPLPNLEQMIEGALEPVPKPMGPNARFAYPLRGGFQALMDGFLPLLSCDLELEASIVAVSPSRREVRLADGRRFGYGTLVSTMALPTLVKCIGDEAPAEIRAAAAALRHVSVRCVNLGIGREAITEKHWIYYPEDTVFHRIFVQGNASPHCNAPGGFGLTCEITYSPHKALPVDGHALIDRCIADCIQVGIINADDTIVASNQVDMPYAYVVYDHERATHVETIRTWAGRNGILLAGRYSEWEYYNSDHAFLAGHKVAMKALALKAAGPASRDRLAEPVA